MWTGGCAGSAVSVLISHRPPVSCVLVEQRLPLTGPLLHPTLLPLPSDIQLAVVASFSLQPFTVLLRPHTCKTEHNILVHVWMESCVRPCRAPLPIPVMPCIVSLTLYRNTKPVLPGSWPGHVSEQNHPWLLKSQPPLCSHVVLNKLLMALPGSAVCWCHSR